jgi:hypothetical protein
MFSIFTVEVDSFSGMIGVSIFTGYTLKLALRGLSALAMGWIAAIVIRVKIMTAKVVHIVVRFFDFIVKHLFDILLIRPLNATE